MSNNIDKDKTTNLNNLQTDTSDTPTNRLISTKPLRVLVVEDDEVNRMVILRYLQAKGCTVDTATNGQKALALLGNEIFDIVLMDISMPKIDGLTLTRQLKKHSRTQNIPVVAVTAYSSTQDRERLLAQGMDGFVAKPINPEELFNAIIQLTSEKSDAIDQEGLIIRTSGDMEFMKELAELFYETSTAIINQINQSSNLTEIAEMAHKLKGSAETAGAKPIADVAIILKTAAQQGDFAACHIACSSFAPAMDSYRKSLAKLGINLPDVKL